MINRFRHHWHKTPKAARQIIVLIIGIIIVLAGIAMLVLPGPGWATIFLGLAVLATEFEQAERIRAAVIKRFKKAIQKAIKAVPKR